MSGSPERARVELEAQKTPPWHIRDEVRVGVVAGLEEHETWLQAHLLRCDACRRSILVLLGEVQGTTLVSDEGGVSCAQARNALFHYLESGRPPAFVLLQHLLTCDSCSEVFYEPARAAAVLEFDPEETGEAG